MLQIIYFEPMKSFIRNVALTNLKKKKKKKNYHVTKMVHKIRRLFQNHSIDLEKKLGLFFFLIFENKSVATKGIMIIK